jgi:hypothetical protein
MSAALIFFPFRLVFLANAKQDVSEVRTRAFVLLDNILQLESDETISDLDIRLKSSVRSPLASPLCLGFALPLSPHLYSLPLCCVQDLPDMSSVEWSDAPAPSGFEKLCTYFYYFCVFDLFSSHCPANYTVLLIRR